MIQDLATPQVNTKGYLARHSTRYISEFTEQAKKTFQKIDKTFNKKSFRELVSEIMQHSKLYYGY